MNTVLVVVVVMVVLLLFFLSFMIVHMSAELHRMTRVAETEANKIVELEEERHKYLEKIREDS